MASKFIGIIEAESVDVSGNILLTGDVTTTNQARTIDFTGFDKEGTTDFSDRAYIQHTVNTGGHSGSVLVISSQNDAADGIAFATHASSMLKHNGNTIWTAGNDGSGSGLDADKLDGQQGSYYQKKTIIQDATPSGANGDFWWDSTDGVLNVNYNGQWVEASPSGAGAFLPLSGGTLTGALSVTSNIASTTDISADGNITAGGNITASGDVTAYSDERLKENITVIENSLEKIKQVRGVTFDRKLDGARSTGVIAQELQQVLPEAVHEDDEGMLNVAYGNVVGILIEAIKEMSNSMDAMKAEIEQLKGE